MTDQGFQVGADDGGIDLSFGPETIKTIEFGPAPDGLYKLGLYEVPNVVKTKRGETMLTFQFVVEGPGAAGKRVFDNAVIPGQDRRQETGKTGDTIYDIMMNMLRDKLEALTGKPWREDDMKLKPSDLSGNTIIAYLISEPGEFTDKRTGEKRMGSFNKIDGSWRRDDGSLDGKINDAIARGVNGASGSESQTGDAPAAKSGGFQI